MQFCNNADHELTFRKDSKQGNSNVLLIIKQIGAQISIYCQDSTQIELRRYATGNPLTCT